MTTSASYDTTGIPATTDVTRELAAAWLAGKARLHAGDQLAAVLELIASRIRAVGDLPHTILRVHLQVCDTKSTDAEQRDAVDQLAALFGVAAKQNVHYVAEVADLRFATTAKPPVADRRAALLAELAQLDTESPRPDQRSHTADYGINLGPTGKHFEISGTSNGDFISKTCNCGEVVSGSRVEARALFQDHLTTPDRDEVEPVRDPVLDLINVVALERLANDAAARGDEPAAALSKVVTVTGFGADWVDLHHDNIGKVRFVNGFVGWRAAPVSAA